MKSTPRLKKVEELIVNNVRIVVLGDTATNGASYAEATIIFPKKKVDNS